MDCSTPVVELTHHLSTTMTRSEVFTVGQPVRVTGVHKMHWEWPRFEVKQKRLGLWARTIRCELIAAAGVPATPLEVVGGELPANWRHHPPLAFHVVADVTPLAREAFGHLGRLEWQLRVDRWIEVTPLGVVSQQ